MVMLLAPLLFGKCHPKLPTCLLRPDSKGERKQMKLAGDWTAIRNTSLSDHTSYICLGFSLHCE